MKFDDICLPSSAQFINTSTPKSSLIHTSGSLNSYRVSLYRWLYGLSRYYRRSNSTGEKNKTFWCSCRLPYPELGFKWAKSCQPPCTSVLWYINELPEIVKVFDISWRTKSRKELILKYVANYDGHLRPSWSHCPHHNICAHNSAAVYRSGVDWNEAIMDEECNGWLTSVARMLSALLLGEVEGCFYIRNINSFLGKKL